MVNNKKKIQVFFLIFSLVLTFIFFYSGLIHSTYVPFWKITSGDWSYKTYSNFKYFVDTQTVFLASECNKAGFNVFAGECLSEYGFKKGHAYGRSLLYLPLINDNFKNLFFIIYGSVLISSLIFIVFKLINPKTIYENIICLILILNPTTLLLFERLNFDLVIFLSLVLIVFLEGKYILKILIKFLVFSFKFYPLIFIINFFIENQLNLKNKIFYSFLLIFISSLLFFINLDDFIMVASNFKTIGRNIVYSFSLNAFSRIIDHLFIIDKNIIKSVLILVLFFFSSICYMIFSKKIKTPLEYSPRTKLFFVSANLLIVLYFFFNNNYFREVFFIGVVPYLLIADNEKCLFSRICLSLIVLKYFFMILFWPKVIFADINVDLFAQLVLGVKIFLDYIIIMALVTYMLKLNISVFKKTFESSV